GYDESVLRAVQADRRGEPRDRVEAALLRQGALPRQLQARPDPPAAQGGPRARREGRGPPGGPADVPRGAGRPPPDRARREDPGGRHRGPEVAGLPRDEDPRGVRRPRPQPGLLQQGAGPGRHLPRRAGDAAVGAPVDRPPRAAAHVRHRGAEARVAPEGRQHAHLGLPAHRAGRRLGPGAHERDGRPDRGRHGLQDQRHQAVGDQRRDRRRGHRHGRRAQDGDDQGRHHRLHRPLRLRGHHRRDPQRLHGPARDRELPHPLRGRPRPERRGRRRGGQGPARRARHPQHGPSVAARDRLGVHEVLAEDLARVGAGAQAVGQAGGHPRPGRAEAGLPGGHRVRPGRPRRRLEPPRGRQAQRLPGRGRAREALRLRDGLAGGRHDDPDPRRPRVRDRRVAQGARREADPGRADAARHADQPHLRGLHGDHAPADRPRGARPAPRGRGRHPRPEDRHERQGQGGRRRGEVLRRLPADARHRRGPEAQGLRAGVRPAGQAPALRRAPLAQARALDHGPHGRPPGVPGAEGRAARPRRRHRRGALRDLLRVRLRVHDRHAGPRPPRGGLRAGRPLRQAGAASRGDQVLRAVPQRRQRPVQDGAAGARGPLHVVRGRHPRSGRRGPAHAQAHGDRGVEVREGAGRRRARRRRAGRSGSV
ncbi:MAG: Acyl-CoA dehydrogenase, partial [uncultured Solirubrobacteraceae bacterium]